MGASLSSQGRARLVQNILGTIFSIPRYIAWGTGVGTTNPTDETVFNEVVADGRVNGNISAITTSTNGDTYQVTGTLTSLHGGTITNVGIFDSAIIPYQTTLQIAISSPTQTTITVVNPGVGTVPITPFNIQILSEIMTVTSISGNVWTVTRGVNQSSALSSIPLASVVTTVSGTMFAKADFAGLPLNAGDSVSFTIQVQFE
jgi:hypothetical protein